MQLALDYDPQPPFGGIDWAHIPPLPHAMRRAIGLLAPAIVAKPERLTRAAGTGVPPVSPRGRGARRRKRPDRATTGRPATLGPFHHTPRPERRHR